MSEHALLLHECRSLSFHCAACTRRMPDDYFEMVRRPTKQSEQPIKSLEMFTGAGGLALGTHLSGFEHVGLIEWDDRACETLRQNVRSHVLPGVDRWNVLKADVRTVDFDAFGAVDVVSGGPPCQPFSIGGKHSGMDDWRNMIPWFCRAISKLTPRAFIMENVKGLLRPRFETYFSYILLCLTYPTVGVRETESWLDHFARLEKIHTRARSKDLHYHVVFRLVNAADYGVPQTRERVFLVGFRADTGIEWSFPEKTHDYGALVREQENGTYWNRHHIAAPKSLERSSFTSQVPLVEPRQRMKPWRTVRDALSGLPDPNCASAASFANHELVPGARAYPGHIGSPLDLPAKTLKAGDHGVPGGENMIAFANGSVRYFTVREAARLQTFPDKWRFEGAWSRAMKQLGNAVPVELARVVASSVADRLREADGRTRIQSA
jgi:DNA (cytosine-5)-methyltransferase 1